MSGFKVGKRGMYVCRGEVSERQILDKAKAILKQKTFKKFSVKSPQNARDYLVAEYCELEREVMGVLLLDTQLNVICHKQLFWGTIDGASVYPREIIRLALLRNAKSLILVHNHPSGTAEASGADISITHRIQQAASLVDIEVLDHIIVAGAEAVSMAEANQLISPIDVLDHTLRQDACPPPHAREVGHEKP